MLVATKCQCNIYELRSHIYPGGTNVLYVVVTANLTTKNPISWSKWSYYFTIYTPHDSLDYHIT